MLLHEQLGIYQVELPLLHRVRNVNCYAVKGKDGWSLVDAGLSREATCQVWLKFFEEYAIKPLDIKGIYLTHFHSDHYGCSGWLQKYSGAPVYIGVIDAERIINYWHKGDFLLKEIAALFRANGMPEEVLSKVLEAETNLMPYTLPHAELTILQEGQTVNLGDHEYRVILTPGHSDGHVCFYSPEYGLLFSGDHLLPDTSSIISLAAHPGALSNPLADFLCSINNMRHLNCSLILPAHGKPFANIEKRINRLESYHQKHLQLIKKCIGGGTNAYEVCRRIYSSEISSNEWRFVMAEILAHLVYLSSGDELEAVLVDGVYRYRCKDS